MFIFVASEWLLGYELLVRQATKEDTYGNGKAKSPAI